MKKKLLVGIFLLGCSNEQFTTAFSIENSIGGMGGESSESLGGEGGYSSGGRVSSSGGASKGGKPGTGGMEGTGGSLVVSTGGAEATGGVVESTGGIVENTGGNSPSTCSEFYECGETIDGFNSDLCLNMPATLQGDMEAFSGTCEITLNGNTVTLEEFKEPMSGGELRISGCGFWFWKGC